MMSTKTILLRCIKRRRAEGLTIGKEYPVDVHEDSRRDPALKDYVLITDDHGQQFMFRRDLFKVVKPPPPDDTINDPAAPRFVAVGHAILRGQDTIARARSHTFAKRIANALNLHQPNREGV